MAMIIQSHTTASTGWDFVTAALSDTALAKVPVGSISPFESRPTDTSLTQGVGRIPASGPEWCRPSAAPDAADRGLRGLERMGNAAGEVSCERHHRLDLCCGRRQAAPRYAAVGTRRVAGQKKIDIEGIGRDAAPQHANGPSRASHLVGATGVDDGGSPHRSRRRIDDHGCWCGKLAMPARTQSRARRIRHR